jgi:eukaryotic-like serine/threonine-protein kinase
VTVGETLLHYKVVRRVGSGASGTVYKAVDTKLDRFVALKVMNHPAIGDSSKRRFIQEARAASALEHQNICTVHDIVEAADGRLVLVMAYYEGDTVAERLKRGRLAFEEAGALVRQIAGGLLCAHEYGIVHRDVKPANMIVTARGELKIVDFGLAKLRASAAQTQDGRIRGTPYYMSPEQIIGGPLDHRSDIWSTGVVLYEMLTGQKPFRGSTIEAVLHGILYDTPPPVTSLRPDTPAHLAAVIEAALAKPVRDRVQSCTELLTMLDGQAAPRSVPAADEIFRRSILVMPFESLGKGKEAEYFALGLSDDITALLSRLGALRVFARTAAERIKESHRRIDAVAREFDIDFVVNGAVRLEKGALRVSASLADSRTGALLWAERFGGPSDDVFAIQEMLARNIVKALRLRLSVPEQEHFAARPFADVASYECYLRAKQEFVRYSAHSLERALSYIHAAQARVGDNVLLLAAAGQIYWQMVNAGVSMDRTYLVKANACAERILELDPLSPHGRRIKGMVALNEGSIRSAVELLETAATIDPTDTDTLSLLAVSYGYIGRPQHGLAWAHKLLELDPLTPMYQALPGVLGLMAGTFDEAQAPFATSFKMDPGNPLVALCYGQCLALNRLVPEAINMFEEVQRCAPDSFLARVGRMYQYALQGKAAAAHTCVTEEVEAIAEWDLYHAWNLAQCYGILGNTSRASHWLERATTRGLLNYPLLARLDPFLESIRGTQHFKAILRTVKQQWSELNAPAAPLRARTARPASGRRPPRSRVFRRAKRAGSAEGRRVPRG